MKWTHKEDLNSLFTPEVLTALVPLLLNSPQIPSYDSRVDPKVLICLFMDALIAWGIEDMHMCRFFHATFKGTASYWFHSLPNNSIGNFWTLHQHFLAQFEGSIRLCKETSDLFSLQQRESKSLKGYVSQFMDVATNIEPLNQAEVVQAFRNSIRN